MSEINRFKWDVCNGGIWVDPEGGYVLYSDHLAAKEAEREQSLAILQAEVQQRVPDSLKTSDGQILSVVERMVLRIQGLESALDVERAALAAKDGELERLRKLLGRSGAVCVHCGFKADPVNELNFETTPHPLDAIREHARECQGHPLRARIAELEAELAAKGKG